MYVLIRIGTNDRRTIEFISKIKNKLVNNIKESGYYWSQKHNRYVDDKKCGINGGSGVDYIIDEIEEL